MLPGSVQAWGLTLSPRAETLRTLFSEFPLAELRHNKLSHRFGKAVRAFMWGLPLQRVCVHRVCVLTANVSVH